jgi:hypothetical protein
MKGLHTPSEHLRRFRDIGDVPKISFHSLKYTTTLGTRGVLNRDASVPDLLRSPAGAKQAHALLV